MNTKINTVTIRKPKKKKSSIIVSSARWIRKQQENSFGGGKRVKRSYTQTPERKRLLGPTAKLTQLHAEVEGKSKLNTNYVNVGKLRKCCKGNEMRVRAAEVKV